MATVHTRVSRSDGTFSVRHLKALIILAGLAAFSTACGPDSNANPSQPKGKEAKEISDLIFAPIVIALVIGVAVTAVVLYAVFKFRDKGDGAIPEQVHGNRAVELGATIGSALILAVLAVPSYAMVQKLAETPRNALNVEAVGKQWWWQFRYTANNAPGVGNYSVVTANELVIPKGRSVRVKIRACDAESSVKSGVADSECNVIHSFWVPSLNGKADAVPNRDNKLILNAPTDSTSDTYGEYKNAAIYDGICAEYCGLSHANMRFKVVALDKVDYENWFEHMSSKLDASTVDENGTPLGAEGKLATKFACVNCHSFDPAKSLHGPNLAHFAARATFASGRFDITRENVVKWIKDAPSMIPMESQGCAKSSYAFTGNHVPGTEKSGENCVGMPSFIKDRNGDPVMTDDEAEALADFLLSLK